MGSGIASITKVEVEDDCRDRICGSVDCVVAIAAKSMVGVMRALVSTRESASATTLSNPGTCRILDVNCEM